jgi:hypothetical protein
LDGTDAQLFGYSAPYFSEISPFLDAVPTHQQPVYRWIEIDDKSCSVRIRTVRRMNLNSDECNKVIMACEEDHYGGYNDL